VKGLNEGRYIKESKEAVIIDMYKRNVQGRMKMLNGFSCLLLM
jgi:hypothetical protein